MIDNGHSLNTHLFSNFMSSVKFRGVISCDIIRLMWKFSARNIESPRFSCLMS